MLVDAWDIAAPEDGVSGSHKLITAIVIAVLWTGCSINKSTVLEAGAGGGEEGLAARAETAFAEAPRTAPGVREAYSLMRQAAQRGAVGDPRRYEYLQRAARFAIWLIYNAETDTLINEALALTNTAIEIDSNRVEGYYYRAIIAGLLAQKDRIKGRAAMRSIQEDAGRALALDANFDDGGPPRVLGAIYLRAPGPPAGIGSIHRAVRLLEQAYQIASDHPENILFLAEAYLASERTEEARALLDTLPADINAYGDPTDRARWQTRTDELRQKIRP